MSKRDRTLGCFCEVSMRYRMAGLRVRSTACVTGSLSASALVASVLVAPYVLRPAELRALAIGTDALLAVVAAILATAAAILARIDAPWEPRVRRRLAAALAFYGLVLVPLGVLRTPGQFTTGFALTELVAYGLFAFLLAWALTPPAGPGGPRWTTLVVVAGSVTAGIALIEWLVPGSVAAPWAAHLLLIGVWAALALVLTASGVLNRQRTLRRAGLGLTLVAGAHALHAGAHTSVSALQFGVVRLAGLLVLVVALGVSAVRLIRSARLRERCRAERRAVERPVPFAPDASLVESDERAHEIRNALTGLSGLSVVLNSDEDMLSKADLRLLGSALTAELDRLHHLVRGQSTGQDAAVQLGNVLGPLVALWRARGAPIALDLQIGLRVAMPQAELTQVLTNLLANCDRHAPGARVRIAAAAHEGAVVITVADDGPGLLPERIVQVTTAAYHDPAAGGSGIGLRLSARLLRTYGGSLRLAPGPHGRGCVVEVRIPDGTPRQDASERTDERRDIFSAGMASRSA